MTDPLSRRPDLGPPPPPGGAEGARRTAARRRRARRQALGGVAAGSALALVAVVVAAGSGPAALGPDELVPASPEPVVSSAAPDPSPAPATTGSPGASPAASADAEVTKDPAPAGASPSPPAGSEQTGAAAAPPYRTPEMRRTEGARPRPTGGPAGPAVCGGGVTGSQEEVEGQVGWCVDLAVEPTSDGHRFALSVCRDDGSDGELTFGTSLETEMVVRRGGTEVWRWSRDHPVRDERHVLAVPRGRCWTWSLDYTDVDARGRELPPGTYEVQAVSAAKEVAGSGDQRAEIVLA
jgi:hypothetical protein